MSRPPVTRFLVVFFALWSLRAAGLQRFDEVVPDGLARRAWMDGLRLVGWGVLPWAWMTRVDGVGDPWTYTRLRGPVAPVRLLVLGLGGVGWLVGARLVSARQGRGWVTPAVDAPGDAEAWLAWGVGLVAVAVLEEFLFRGYLLRRLEDGPTAPAAAVLQAVAFGAAHLPGWWFAHGADGALILPNLVYVVLFGVVLGVITRGSGSLWPAIVLHAANNVLAAWPLR